MAYLGQVDRKASNIQVFNVASSTSATHNIGWTPPSEQTIIVTINGVKQHTNAYSFSGAVLTLSSALVTTDELEVIGLNDIGNSLTPVDGSVTASKLGADSVITAKILDNNVTLAKMAGLARGKIIVGDSSGDPSALALGASTYLLTSDGSDAAWAAAPAGGLSRMDTWMLDTDMNTIGGAVTLISSFTHSSDAAYSDYMIKNVGAAFAAPSTGIFTFPETGTWQASLSTYLYAHNGYYTQLRIWVDATADDGSNWYTNAIASNEVANTTYGGSRVTSSPLNISDLSNDKVRFQFRRHSTDAGYINVMAPGNTSSTGMAAIGTFVTFTKLA